ncbi:phosphate ABC transporter permease subunit PstC [Nocardioides sp.]|uniref:phosphate ABC transporter permease subunit PstC n=1 Tax=Nocardioides sp. TaxID=35761 RepID=UPI003512800B
MSTTLPERERVDDKPTPTPRPINKTFTGVDAIFAQGARAVGATVLIITGGVGLFLGYQGYPTLQRYGWSFFTEREWNPEADVIGIAAVLLGTIVIATVAMTMAFPLALLTALYISEYAPPRLKPTLVSIVDLMAAVPSVVYGLWGALLIMEYASQFALFVDRTLGWIPIFDVVGGNPDAPAPTISRYSFSAFCAAIAVAMMVTPMACAVMRQVFSQTPPGEKEAALALGATRWGMIRSVVLPFGRGGIIGGSMLGLGRALGETIAVVLILSTTFEFKVRPFELGGNSVSALIANRFAEADGNQLSALLAAGFVLFLITLVINTLAAMVVNRSRSGAGTDA